MAETTLQLKQASDGNTFLIGENDILKVFTDTLGAQVVYTDQGAVRKSVVVSETAAQVKALSKVLTDVTLTEGGSVVYINVHHVITTDNNDSTGSIIEYDNQGASNEYINVTESPSTLQAEWLVLAGHTQYTIDVTNLTADSFTLTAGAGDVTAIFAAAKVFSVIGSTGNDGTYSVQSSSFGGGKTTIVVTSQIADGTDDGSIFIVN